MAPANQAFGRFWTTVFTGFYGFWWVFTGLSAVFFADCGEAASSKVLLTKIFFSQKPTQNKVLIARPGFFRDLVDVGCMMMISNCGKYLSQPSLGTKISFMYLKSLYIYIEFRSFGGICCGGILTLQKTRFGGPGKPSFWSVLDYGFYGFLWVLMSFYRFSAVFFRGLWRSCFIKNLVLLTKTYFFLAETNSKQGFDSSTRVFQGFGWCRIYDEYDDDIKLW